MSVAASSDIVVRHAVLAMGTRFECVLGGEPGQEAFLRAAGEEALGEVLRLHALWSPFERSSAIARVNADAANGAVRVDAETFELLASAAGIHRASGGAFDPTLGALMRHLGFRGKPSDSRAPLPSVGMEHVHLDAASLTVRLGVAGLELDVGAIAKGAAIDAAAGVLRDQGVPCALLHGGTSSVLAIGAPPGQPAWRVRLGATPGDPVALLRDNALSVSAPAGRTLERDGRSLGHVIDPRTREPIAGFRAAAVVHSLAREADAWSTALLVSGELGDPRAQGAIQGNDGAWRMVGPGGADCPALEFSGGEHV